MTCNLFLLMGDVIFNTVFKTSLPFSNVTVIGRILGIFLFTTASRTALGPTQPPIQWIPAALSLRVKRQGLEADHSRPSSAEAKEWEELYLRSPIRLMAWCLVKKHRDNFTFTFFYTMDSEQNARSNKVCVSVQLSICTLIGNCGLNLYLYVQ